MKWLNLMLVFIPISIGLELFHGSPGLIFATSCLSILPLAGIMGEATEEISKYAGSGVGSILNATFGNATELIIAILALKEGLFAVVKASLTGSFIGNILLVMGFSMLLGGAKHRTQNFNRMAAGINASMMALAVIALLVPAVFVQSAGKMQYSGLSLSIGVSVVLIITYFLGLYFSFGTHKDLIRVVDEVSDEDEPKWSKKKSIFLLLLSTILIALESEFLVGTIEHVVKTWGLSEVFIGVIIIPIIGNAAEHGAAVLMAMKNRMDLSLGIAIGSSSQIALFVAPLLVLIGVGIGKPMDLLFSALEVTAIAVSVAIANLISLDGKSNWFEGVQLLAAYVILSLAFFHI